MSGLALAGWPGPHPRAGRPGPEATQPGTGSQATGEATLCPLEPRVTWGRLTLCGASWALRGVKQHPCPDPLDARSPPRCDNHRRPQMWPRDPRGQSRLGENI